MPILYVVIVNIVYAGEFLDSWLVLWNPWTFAPQDSTAFLLHCVASVVIYGNVVGVGLCAFKAVRGVSAVPRRLRLWLAVCLVAFAVIEFLLTPGVISFHYEVLVDNAPLEAPVACALIADKSMVLVDGRELQFRYSTGGCTFPEDKLVEIKTVPGDSEYPLFIVAKVVVRERARKLGLITIPIYEQRVPMYGATPVGGGARFTDSSP